MAVLTLLIMLLLPVAGWAGKKSPITLEYVNKNWSLTDPDSIPIATCDLDVRNCEIHKPEHFPCYQRMQEAMRGMDDAIKVSRRNYVLQYGAPRDSTLILIYDFSRWDNTMRDCVKG